MRIVSWNCNGAFRRKLEAADALNADVLVIQECEDPALSSSEYRKWAGDYLWTGYGKNKGIGIFPRKGQSIEPLDWQGSEYELFLPALLDGRDTVIGVWTQSCTPSSLSYIGQFWHFMQANKEKFDHHTYIVGDFNSNSIWDRPRRQWNHTDCVNALDEMGFRSLYHLAKCEQQGREQESTFYIYRKPGRPFHIEYVFAHKKALESARFNVEIGHPDDWLSLSDHVPVIVDIEESR